MIFKEYKNLNLPEITNEILSYWNDKDIFLRSMDQTKNNKPYVFFEGPPSANGLPGIHHVLARTIKDIFLRYKTMKGYYVKRKAGWDTHGLPVELGVESSLGITKEDIGRKITVEEYNSECKKAVMKYTDVWNNLTMKMGYWLDVDNPYVTYNTKYMESVWWLIKQIYDKGLMYKGYTIQPYSPKAGTAISSHELNQPGTYQDVTDTSVTAQFKLLNKNFPSFLETDLDIFLLAWTTTPWTLPSNTALTVGPKIMYARVRSFNQYTGVMSDFILADDLIQKQFSGNYYKVDSIDEITHYRFDPKQIPYFKINTFHGKEIENLKYEQLLDYAKPTQGAEDAFRVILGDFVTTVDGTGIVHTAPTFGADDAVAAKAANPPIPPLLVSDEKGDLVPLVDLQGKFRPEMKDLAGKYVKNEYYLEQNKPERSVDVEIAIKLKKENKAFRVEKYKHSYPNCWRTDKPILYYPVDSWFIKASKVREKMSSLNKKINWKPKSTGEGRFEKWLENVNDWNLSRSRFWGIPLPIWISEDGKEKKCIGSIEELIFEINHSVDKGFMKSNLFNDFEVNNFTDKNYSKVDLHKHMVDEIVLVSKSGKKMFREPDIIDVWFDSGSMPYAQWHYPFENKNYIDDNKFFPADYIAEGVDQTRGWFYTLHVIGTLVFNSNSYKNVISNGLVLDKNGQKMSKRLGNAVDPFETLDKFGPDATRWYMISNSNPWDNLKFDVSGIEEVRRKFFGTLHNIYSFFSLYANIDEFKNEEKIIDYKERCELDRWIISELNTLVKEVNDAYENYEPTKSARLISKFVQDNLSNWYVRLSRRRFWKGEYNTDKIAAFQTLLECLKTVSILSSPISPFFMDNLFQDLTMNNESVHLTDFPNYSESLINKELQTKIRKSQEICSLALSLRKKEKIKVRQPLNKIIIPYRNDLEKEGLIDISEFIKSEINVKNVELVGDSSKILVKKAKPNFKLLGPKFGKDLKIVSSIINNLKSAEIEKIENEKALVLENNIEILLEDIEIYFEDIEGWQVVSENGTTIALDTNINEELKNEGIAREIVNRIQNFRKDFGFNVSDKIIIEIENNNLIEKAIFENIDYIKNETLAVDLNFKQTLINAQEFEFDNLNIKIKILKNT